MFVLGTVQLEWHYIAIQNIEQKHRYHVRLLDATSASNRNYRIKDQKCHEQCTAHTQLHTGELCERLGQAGIDVEWVGMVRD